MSLPSDPDSVTRSVAETLMGRVLDGTYGPGARLPSERDLAEQLGVARVSVRQALAILGSWRVVTTVRGSGATVSPDRAWTSDVLPSALTYALLAGRWGALARLMTDGLELRRSIVLTVLERAAPHLGPGMLDGAKKALDRACAALERGDRRAFFEADREVIPLILEAADMRPSLWHLNSLAAPYLLVMARFGEQAKSDPHYRDAHLETMAALERGDGAAACARFSKFLDVSDRLIVEALPEDLRARLAPKPAATHAAPKPSKPSTPSKTPKPPRATQTEKTRRSR